MSARRPRAQGAAARHALLRFDGWIAGLGTASGTRIVLGHWPRSPFGPFSDVMLERGDGRRLLLAPTREIADFVSATYVFDAVRVLPVDVRVTDATWRVTAGPLRLRFTTGRRGFLGYLLSAVPGALARRPAWCVLTDLPARALLRGVRTRGSARTGRREWYGARDLRPIRTVSAVFEGDDLGAAAPVEPPVRFGFGSVPRRPSLTRVTTTIAPGPAPGVSAPGPGTWDTMNEPTPKSPDGPARRRMLGIYLNDHLAGATAGTELARRMVQEHRASAYGSDLERLAAEISEDRQALIGLLADLGVPVRRYKLCAAWLGEKLGRVKPNGRLLRRSGLTVLVELEALRLGALGKAALWRALLSVAAMEPRLNADRVERLLRRAERQIKTLDALHAKAVAHLFRLPGPRPTPRPAAR